MTFGRRPSRCCCDPIVSPCQCTGSFNTFEISISGVTDVSCSGNADNFNGTHLIDRGDGDCNDPPNTNRCWGTKQTKGDECLYLTCSYGEATCNNLAANTADCEDAICTFPFNSEDLCGCCSITAYVRTSPTDPVNNMLLQVRMGIWHVCLLDYCADTCTFEADIAKTACTSVISESLTLVDSSYISDGSGYDCDSSTPYDPVNPCGKCVDFDSATVTMTLTT